MRSVGTPTEPVAKLCSKCGVEPRVPGQRWGQQCRAASAAAQREKMPKSSELSLLIQDPHNANKGTDRGRRLLKSSIEDLGFGRSVLLDKNNKIIAGNKTVEAALAAGMTKLRIIDIDGTEPVALRRTNLDLDVDAVAKKLAIVDNRVGQVGLDWDLPNLKQAFDMLNLKGFFTDKERGALMAGLGESLGNDEAPDPPAAARTQLGDLYALGPHRLLCASSLEPENIAKVLDGKLAHMVWTDPPYNVDYKGGTGLQIMNDAMSEPEFSDFLHRSMAALASGLLPGGACYVAHADSSGHVFRLAFRASGMLLKQCLIWAKDGNVMGRQDHQWGHEPILYGFKEAAKGREEHFLPTIFDHEPILYGWKAGAAHDWYGGRAQGTIFSYARPKRSTVHPTMKPIALVEQQIRNSTKEGDLILDGFGGSGTTLMAAEVNKRRAALLELDPRYCDVIVKRWEEATGLTAQLVQSDAIAHITKAEGVDHSEPLVPPLGHGG